MPAAKPSPNSIALAGEFAALSQLALRGYDANLTLGNTKNVDILVSDPESGAMCRLEVKTSGYRTASGGAERNSRFWGRHYAWVMGKKHEEVKDPLLFYCFVTISGEEGTSFRFFVVPSRVVAEYVEAQHQIWLSGDSRRKDTTMRMFRLGLDESEIYPLPTPLAADYENRWGFGT